MSAEPNAAPPGVKPIPISVFKDKVLALYQPPAVTPQTRNAVRHVFRVLARTPGVTTTADLTPGVVDRYREAQGNAINPTTLRYLRRVFNLAVDMGCLVDSPLVYNPFPKAKPYPNRRKAPKTRGAVLTDEQAARVVAYLRERATSWTGFRLYSLACTALYTPFRKSEILYLRADAYDPAAGVIRLQHGCRAPAEFSVLDEHKPSLDGWAALAGDGWLYPNHLSRGTPWTTNHYPYSANHEVKAAGEAAGVPGLTFESLRFYRHAELAALLRKPGPTGSGRKKAAPPVVLRLIDDPPIVLTIVKPCLPQARYDVVMALLAAGARGLTKSELDEKSGHAQAHVILRKLRDSDEDWGAVIRFPGKNGQGGYRIEDPR